MKRPRARRRGAGKLLALMILLVGAGGALLFVAYRAAGTHSKRTAAQEEAAKAAQVAGSLEEDRTTYVQQNVVINDLKIGPDTKPGTDEPVPGLLRVTGVVVNKGDRKLDRVVLNLFLEDAQGQVIGSYLDNIAGATGMEPGAARDFHFQIPEKKEYAGKFNYTVK